jgi:hypothetical protein
MKRVEVGKISLKIGEKKEISLSLEEARELQKVLTDLLGMKDDNVIVAAPLPVTTPYPIPPASVRGWKVERE